MTQQLDKPLRFDFGVGEPQEGYVKVTPQCRYDKTVGYGFTRTEKVNAKDREEPGPLRRDFCIPLETAFAVDIPNGLYWITLLMGDEIAPSETTVRVGGENRLAVHKQRTIAGHYAGVDFAVKVKNGQLLLSFEGSTPRINALDIKPTPSITTFYLAGDSTVADQPVSMYPFAGWGQMFSMFLKRNAAVDNQATSGRSSVSFIAEGRLDNIWAEIRPGDFLLIQFGHNDSNPDKDRYADPSTTYKTALKAYIDGARERGACPVLVTPMHQRRFNPDGTVEVTHGEYQDAMRELAVAENVLLIDLADRSKEHFERLGPQGTTDLFVCLAPGEYANFPQGLEDNTHFQQRGAMELARIVWEELKGLNLFPLRMYLR